LNPLKLHLIECYKKVFACSKGHSLLHYLLVLEFPVPVYVAISYRVPYFTTVFRIRDEIFLRILASGNHKLQEKCCYYFSSSFYVEFGYGGGKNSDPDPGSEKKKCSDPDQGCFILNTVSDI
jgi:hypothetical protein